MAPPACPICGSPATRFRLRNRDFLFHTTTQIFDFHRCTACGSGFLHPPPAPETLRAAYPEPYWWITGDAPPSLSQRLEEAYREVVLRHHVRVVRALAPPGQVRLLDVGCGSATFLQVFRSRTGITGKGLETSPQAAQSARKKYGLEVTVGEVETAEFPPGSFTLATLFHVLEHLPEPAAALRRIAGWLAPGGRVLVQVPNLDSLQFRLFGRRWTGIDIPRHLVGFTPRSLGRTFAEAGLKALEPRFWSLRDDAPAAVSSLFPGLDPVAVSIRRHNRFAFARKILYFALVAAATPPTFLEACLGRGATVFMAAEKLD